MKLSDIVEGTFGNLASLAAAKMGSKPEDRLLVKSNQKLFGLVQKAKTFEFHLFDKRAVPWWKEVFDHFKIPPDHRKEIVIAIRSEYFDRIDHSLFEADLSKIADFLNPRTREGTAKSSARSATAEKLAIIIIGQVSRMGQNSGKEEAVDAEVLQKPKVDKQVQKLARRVMRGYSAMRNLKAKGFQIISGQIKSRGTWNSSPPPVTKEIMGLAQKVELGLSAQKKLSALGFRVNHSKDPPVLTRL